MNSQTIMLGVIGDPIGHSKSPAMMNRAFQELQVNYVYGAFRVTAAQLPAAIAGVRALGMRGLNVTIPHKEAVLELVDELDESARLIGAVNTIVNHDGVLRGYNTDGIGYARSLIEETGIDLADKTVVIIGAGGAARALIYALAKRGVRHLWLVNRTIERAQQLAAHFSSFISIAPLPATALAVYAAEIDVVINTTSVGMAPHIEACPLADVSWIRPGMIVSDLVYNPERTSLLTQAQTLGAQTHSGLGMLVYQGAYALEYWTGLAAPVAAMWEGVRS